MSIKVRVVAGPELAPDLAAQWHALQQSNPVIASPYFCPEFTHTVAAVRDDVEIAVLEEGNRVAGFFPYQRGQRGVAVPVGGILSDYQGLVCAPGFECDPPGLLKSCRLIAWDFDHLLASQKCFEPFHLHREPSPQINVSHGYKAYVTERRAAGSEQIKKCGNLMRRIEREVGPLRFVPHSADVTLLGRVLRWKSQQYLTGGKADLFALGWARPLIELVHAAQAEDFAGMLSLLYAGERLVAGHFGMRSRTVWHYWFPSYDEVMAKYSPGLILLLKLAEYAPSIGLRVIDMGKGMSLYKERLMNASVTLASGSVELPSLRSLRRAAQRKLRALVVSTPLAGPARRFVHWARGKSNGVA